VIPSGRWFCSIHSTVLRPSRRSSLQLAAVQQHLAEAEVVPHRGDQPAASERIAGGLRDWVAVLGFNHFQHSLFARPVDQKPGASPFPAGTQKAGVGHTQRGEDALLQEILESLPRSQLDDVAQHINRKTVAESPARLEGQRAGQAPAKACIHFSSIRLSTFTIQALQVIP